MHMEKVSHAWFIWMVLAQEVKRPLKDRSTRLSGRQKQANQSHGTHHVNGHIMDPLDIVFLLIRIIQLPPTDTVTSHLGRTEDVCQHAGCSVIPLSSVPGPAWTNASAPFTFISNFHLHYAPSPLPQYLVAQLWKLN
jgi:hypothetical protein